MSAALREQAELDEERQMQRAIEASLSLHSALRSQLSQGNSLTRRKKLESLRSLSTDVNTQQEQTVYSYRGAGFSGTAWDRSGESDDEDALETTIDFGPFPPPLLSREEMFQAKMRAIGENSSPTDILTTPETIAPRPNIDDYIAEMQNIRAINLVPLNMPDGDTLVFIDAPAQQPSQDDFTYSQIQARYSNPFRMRSSTLRSLGSPFFDNLLGSTSQFRVLRRRKLFGNLPDNTKYVIDLSPPNEGENAVTLTQNLSCTDGVRQWPLSAWRWNISEGLVGGQDELSHLRVQPPKSKGTSVIQWIQGKETVTETVVVNDTANSPGGAPKTPVHRSMTSSNGNSPTTKTSPLGLEDQRRGETRQKLAFKLPDDYTPIRHRFAIERVLNGIEGCDPKLDSAVKVWTTFAVAKYFGIKESLLTDYIVRWLRAPPNTYFMEVQPEVALKMAEGLHCQAVGRDVFAILVGEAALAVVCEGRRVDLDYSIHGRRKEFVKENRFEPWLTRIQYARDVLVDRVMVLFEDLTSMNSTWVEELPEFRKLLEPKNYSIHRQKLYADLARHLKMYVRGAIYHLICSNYSTMPGPVQDSGMGAELFPQTDFCSTWNLLTHHERVFTRSFWEILRGCRLVVSDVRYGVMPPFRYDVSSRRSDELMDLVKAGVFKNIHPSELARKVSAYYSLDEYGKENATIGLDSGWRKVGPTVENGDKNTPPPKFNITYRPKGHEMRSNFDLLAADDDWMYDDSMATLYPPSRSSFNVPIRTVSPSRGAMFNDAESVYYSHVFASLYRGEDPFIMETHDDVFQNYECESPSKRHRSETYEDSSSRLQARYERRAEENKRELEDLHRQNRSDFGEKRQHAETMCNGSAGSSPYRNFDPFDEDTAPGSVQKNLLSVRTLGQPSISSGRIYDGEKLISESKWNTAFSRAQKTPKTPPPAYNSDTLELPFFAEQSDRFSLKQFFLEVEKHLQLVADDMLAAPDVGQRDPLELALTNTLVCLKESEMKFLPLWAGGNDDGTNGVFNADVPIARFGFSTAGPKVHTGSASSTASSEFEMIDGGSTVHTSTVVNDGYSDTLERRRVYDEDSEWGAVMANKNYGPSFRTGRGVESTADSESTWGHVVTPAGTDDLSMVDTEETAESKIDKGKGKMIDTATLMSSDSVSISSLCEEKKTLLEEEEDYSNIFMEDDADDDASLGVNSDDEGIDDDLELWNDNDFDDFNDADL